MSLPSPEIKKIKITDLSPNDYNPQEMPKEKFRGLVGHMRSIGFTDPLKVRPRDPKDPESISTPYVLVDGEHRLRAFVEVFPEEQEILCAVMRGPDGEYLDRTQAYLSTIAYNFQHGEENPVKMAEVLRLALNEGIMIEDIEDITGMKRNRIEIFMDFQKLPESPDLPNFNPDDTSGLKPKNDPIIMAFAVYPEDRNIIERALSEQRKYLEPDVTPDEEKGKCLVVLCRRSLGLFDETEHQNTKNSENSGNNAEGVAGE